VLTVQVLTGAIVYVGVTTLLFRERVGRYVRFVRNLRSGRESSVIAG